jgi:hypothetical protein
MDKTITAHDVAGDVLLQILADAVALAITRPEVIEALRAGLTVKTSEPDTAAGLLTKAQLAKALGKSVSTIDRLDREPGAPFSYCGDTKRYDRDAYASWLAGRGKCATKASKREAEVDVDDVASAAGLVRR